jgi:hypothetical protein
MAMVKSSETSGPPPRALMDAIADGPFTEANFMELHREHWRDWEGETEIRQLFDASDFAPR